MNKLIHLITAFLLLTVSGEAFAQDIIVEIRVGGEVMSPVTLSTSEGTIVVDGSATYNKNVQIYSGKDAQGRDIVVPSGNVSYKTGNPQCANIT